MNAYGNEENSDEAKIDDGVDQDGDTTCLHVIEFNHSVLARQLEQQSWR